MTNKTQELKERIYAHNPELGKYCSLSERVDGKKHTEVFDGDDPYTKCVYCGEVKSATSGMVIVSGYSEKPELHLEHVLRAINESPANIGGFVRDLLNNGYSLTKTFDQNITDNPELVDFLLSVIK